MKKQIISVAFFAVTISITMVATSCSDDICEPTKSSSVVKKTANADKLFFMYGPTNSKNLGVKFDSDKAAIVQCASPDIARNSENNADITYTNDGKTEGYFTMQNTFLGAKKINFIITDGLISLNFSESKSAYDGGKVFLDEQNTSAPAISRASGDIQTGDFKYPDAAKLGGKIASKLLTMGAKKLMGPFGESFFGPVFEAVLGSDGGTDVAAQYSQIQSSLDALNSEMQKMHAEINLTNVNDQYRSYWFEINQQRANNKELLSRNKSCPLDKEKNFEGWISASVNGNSLYSGPMARIQYFMVPYTDGRHNMDIVDEYIFHKHNWESQGYEERDLARTDELYTFTETLMLYKEYKELKGSQDFSLIEKCLDDYLKFYKEHYYYKKHTDKAVCQIEGCYFVTPINADKGYTRCIGQTQFTGNHGMMQYLDKLIKNYFDPDGDWKYTYVFSDKKMSIDDKSITAPYRDKCLKKADIDAIVSHSNNRNVFEVLRDDALMKKLSDDPILLNNRLYADWIHYMVRCNDHEVKMMGSVWLKNGNKYDDNYELDDMVLQPDWWWSKMDYMYVFKSHSNKKVNDIQIDRKSYSDILKYERELMSEEEIKKQFESDLENLK